jgi:hypothetical protein
MGTTHHFPWFYLNTVIRSSSSIWRFDIKILAIFHVAWQHKIKESTLFGEVIVKHGIAIES